MMFGVSSMTARLRRVALRGPGPAMLRADAAAWHYGAQFDRDQVAADHAAFAKVLETTGAEILWMNGEDRGIADSVFTYDASLMTPEGAILMSPGKPQRAGEQELHRAFYQAQGIPVIGEIGGEGRAEGGDTLWLDETNLAVGRGFRTNSAGIAQLAVEAVDNQLLFIAAEVYGKCQVPGFVHGAGEVLLGLADAQGL